jgi:hypothetical protein
MPAGRKRRSSVITTNDERSLAVAPRNVVTKLSIWPRRIPPTTAPPRLPSPPSRMATNALRMAQEPMKGDTAKIGPTIVPAAPARAEPIAKAAVDEASTLIPWRSAASRFWATARIARPMRVQRTSAPRPPTRQSATTMTASRSAGRKRPPHWTTPENGEGIPTSSGPHTIRARFWRRIATPRDTTSDFSWWWATGR